MNPRRGQVRIIPTSQGLIKKADLKRDPRSEPRKETSKKVSSKCLKVSSKLIHVIGCGAS